MRVACIHIHIMHTYTLEAVDFVSCKRHVKCHIAYSGAMKSKLFNGVLKLDESAQNASRNSLQPA
jgi:Ni,Fe-hydrogenase I large subunit